ncbi:MAG: hypothetical protein HAW60_02160 [Bdellovibrionales bacterium]|nr:hypothetical protein [Bdellovibrionales bacterium]
MTIIVDQFEICRYFYNLQALNRLALMLLKKRSICMLKNIIFVHFSILMFVLGFGFNLEAKKFNSNSKNYKPRFLKSSNLNYEWGLSSWRWKEGLNDSLGVLLNVKINWEKELLPNLLFQASVDLKASKKRLQQHIFGSNDSGVYSLRSAKLIGIPTKNLFIEAGILSESFWNKNLLISSSSSFIGFRQSWHILNIKNISVNWNLEQSTPPSDSNDSYRLNNEKLPYFFMSQWDIDWDIGYKKKQWNLKYNLFYTQYFNLPSIVAFQSGLLGNSTRGDAASNSSFDFDFKIVGSGINLYYPLFGAGLESYLFFNYAADKSVANARFLKLYFDKISLFSQDLSLVFENFFVEPDATISYYNSAAYGNNNREGFSVSLSWKINNFSKIGLKYIQSSVINIDAFQEKLQSVSLGLESKI